MLCIQLRYDNARVRVRDWNTGEPFEIARIFRTIAAGALFPYKTTRHFFEPRLPDTSVQLARLRDRRVSRASP
ncbi:conserved hypothetical protein [Cupriavidus taiwanensis]|uniref:hypothetical protein n=1 Tax=Cupriavidus taiwanensis TaxID=164546 RepID=UPI000E1ADB9C|nr:hypothetical protein [Cupriavidus taiwanensis]SPA39668.1 conserved hypothetical protein [Cupriavidus taiwanensis]